MIGIQTNRTQPSALNYSTNTYVALYKIIYEQIVTILESLSGFYQSHVYTKTNVQIINLVITYYFKRLKSFMQSKFLNSNILSVTTEAFLCWALW